MLNQIRIEVITRYWLFVGFLLDKKIGVNQPKRVENAKILIANTPMDTDKIKVLAFLWLHLQCDACIPLLEIFWLENKATLATRSLCNQNIWTLQKC